MIDTERRTDFLFKKRNFFTGFSSVLSIFGDSNMFNTSNSSNEADYKAIKSDWDMIGLDFQRSLTNFLNYKK